MGVRAFRTAVAAANVSAVITYGFGLEDVVLGMSPNGRNADYSSHYSAEMNSRQDTPQTFSFRYSDHFSWLTAVCIVKRRQDTRKSGAAGQVSDRGSTAQAMRKDATG